MNPLVLIAASACEIGAKLVFANRDELVGHKLNEIFGPIQARSKDKADALAPFADKIAYAVGRISVLQRADPVALQEFPRGSHRLEHATILGRLGSFVDGWYDFCTDRGTPIATICGPSARSAIRNMWRMEGEYWSEPTPFLRFEDEFETVKQKLWRHGMDLAVVLERKQ